VLDLSHKFQHLSFGDDLQHQKVKKQFNQGQLNTLDGVARLKPDTAKNTPVQHEHYVSIVPTTYTLLNKQEFQIFQFTANHNEVRPQYYPQMIIR
jgi:endoplasmic reticulum-Golgi intermediate compartment protein 1